MKLTDFALIFVAIFLPVMIIVYVNTSFVIKSEKNEMYYKNIINSATADAVMAMKQVENPNIDYGYSGIVDKKVSINAEVAVNTFYNSLANNFGIVGDDTLLNRLKMYIPVIAIMDYDGIYIHSLEENQAGEINFVTKPKIKYTYTYVIEDKGSAEYDIVDITTVADIEAMNLLNKYIYEVNFTMDDYIYLTIYEYDSGVIFGNNMDIVLQKGFYLTDDNNNTPLVYTDKLPSWAETSLRKEVVTHLANIRKDVIARLGMKHISYAINNHNEYARLSGIRYNFMLSVESANSWYETMDGVGMIAVIQGISLGNRYLNYKAYSASDLVETRKYYVSTVLDDDYSNDRFYLKYNLYHSSQKCYIYEYYMTKVEKQVTPAYYLNKADVATQGYYPCPICKP